MRILHMLVDMSPQCHGHRATETSYVSISQYSHRVAVISNKEELGHIA